MTRVAQYSSHDSIKVKARAGYRCELCGSDQLVQAHAPDGDHSDWRDGVCLCAQHHWEQHLELPYDLFFSKTHQPYWPNVTARALSREFNCHNRTVIRAAKELGIFGGFVLSTEDKERLKMRIVRVPKPPRPKKQRRYLRQSDKWYYVGIELSDSQRDALRRSAREQQMPIWYLVTDLVARKLRATQNLA